MSLNFLTFLRFSTDFRIFSQNKLLFQIWFTLTSLRLFLVLQIGPRFAVEPLERMKAKQLGPQGGARRRPRWNSGDPVTGVGRGRGGGGVWAHQ
jgi:hypothetical protein